MRIYFSLLRSSLYSSFTFNSIVWNVVFLKSSQIFQIQMLRQKHENFYNFVISI